MKKHNIKHLTALVLLFCLTLSAQATITYSTTSSTLTISGGGNDVLTKEYVQSMDLPGFAGTTLKVEGFKSIGDEALSRLWSAKNVTFTNIQEFGVNVLGSCNMTTLTFNGTTQCNLKYNTFTLCSAHIINVNCPIATTRDENWGREEYHKGAFAALGYIQYIKINAPTFDASILSKTYITRLAIGSSVKTITNNCHEGIPMLDVGEIDELEFSASTDQLDLSQIKFPYVRKRMEINRPLSNLGTTYFYNITVVIGGDFPFSGLNIEPGGGKMPNPNLTINNPSFLSNSNGFTGTNNIANKFGNVKNLVIGTEVPEIGNYAFYGCNVLESVNIPQTTTIGYAAFPYFNDNVENATYTEWLAKYTDRNLVTELYIPNDDVANHAYTISANLNHLFPNVLKVVFGSKVTTVGENIFYDENGTNKIESVAILGSVSMGRAAFYNNKKLVSVTDNSITECGHWCFGGCSSLKSISLNTCTTIGEHSFSGCTNLEEVAIGSALTSIADNSFEYCSNLKTLNINNHWLLNSSISITSRFGTNLETVILGEDLTTVKADVFDGSNNIRNLIINSKTIAQTNRTTTANLRTTFPSVVNVKFGPEVEALGNYIFYGSGNLETVVFSDNVTIGQAAFYNEKKLANITSEYITKCSPACFQGCMSLTSMDLRSCTSIEDRAFMSCTGLTEVKVYSPLTEVAQSAFGSSGPKTLYINSSSLLAENRETSQSLYTAFGSKLETVIIGDGVSVIGENAFSGGSHIKNLTLGESVETVASTAFPQSLTSLTINSSAFASVDRYSDNMFERFPRLETLTFGHEVEAVGDNIFYVADGKSSALKEINFNSTPTIGAVAFSNNKSLTTINGTVGSLGRHAFADCSALTSISIAKGPIDIYAFMNCSALESITLPEDLKEIKSGIFNGCSALTEFEIPAGVTSIGGSAFSGCSSLAEVVIPDGVTSIGNYAFNGCTSLAEVEIPASVTSIGSSAFRECSSLKKVICYVVTPLINTNVFFNSSYKTAQLFVLYESISKYKESTVWQKFGKILPIGLVELVDGQPYTNEEDQWVPMVRYTRTFSDKVVAKWQCLYVPFDIKVTNDMLNDFDFAELYMISYKDANNNGEIEDNEPLVMLLMKQNAGKVLHANTPYFIKAKTAGTKSIEVESATLKASAMGTVYCCTTKHEYTLTGIYDTFNINGYYTMGVSGGFNYYDVDTDMKANRWYMQVNSLTGEDEPTAGVRQILIMVDGEDDTTGLMDITSNNKTAKDGIYTLDGRKVNDSQNLRRGIYLINGKKVFVK